MCFDIKYFHNEKNHPTANIIKGKPLPWRFVKKKSGGGNVFDMGVHSIDLIDFFLGEIKIVSSFKKNYKKLYGVEDTLVVNFKLKILKYLHQRYMPFAHMAKNNMHVFKKLV